MGIGSSVIRPLKDALDGMPVHTRQLAEMFRRHGQKQHRNTSDVQNLDSADVTHPLQDGWKSDRGWTPNDIVNSGKGDRPDPSEYLDDDYIKNHLDQFANGGTHVYKRASLEEHGPGNRGTTYVFPTDQLDALMQQVGTSEELGEALGLGSDFFVGAEVELRDFAPHEMDGLRMASGNEGGTDPDKWIPGGYLPSGIPEAVIDIPDYATGTGAENGIYNPGEWPGSPRHLDLPG